MKIGIITGTGLLVEEGFSFVESIPVMTKYGAPSGSYKRYLSSENEIYSIGRHGDNHQYPPHKINYRANIYGFYELGVDFILAFSAVGGINTVLEPGDLLIPDGLVDFTYGRESTYSDVGDVFHIDFTEPFCSSLRGELIRIIGEVGCRFHSKGTYVCTNGPRLETSSEIKMFNRLGFDVVGMTLCPEAALARELGICYAAVNIVSNYAAGISRDILTTAEVVENVKKSERYIREIIKNISTIKSKSPCGCGESIKHARFK
ncbi:MAG: S-methyl-5'-thioinosine phosphorylase [Calditerrivibrio sp.]|nr:S-methyl-5'-thioinosine phosphorylase [Calditerrivibrio sp.]